MFKYLNKKKYVLPFLLNLQEQKNNGNVIFFCNYTPEKTFLIILCFGTKIIQITKEIAISTYEIEINENNFTKWEKYKEKILTLKYEGKSLNSQALIITISEAIRHLSNQMELSFQDTKEILNTLLNFDQSYFLSNQASVIMESSSINRWID